MGGVYGLALIIEELYRSDFLKRKMKKKGAQET